VPGKHYLLGIVHAINALGLCFGFSQSRQKHGRENRDDGNDDEKFDQRKAPAPLPVGAAPSNRVLRPETGSRLRRRDTKGAHAQYHSILGSAVNPQTERYVIKKYDTGEPKTRCQPGQYLSGIRPNR
jgi:hypothetical protein